MKTNVTLQPMMSFSKLPMGILLAVGLFFVVLIILLVILEKQKKSNVITEKKPVLPEIHNMDDAKPRYLGKLTLLEENYQKGLCDTREAYLKMSDLIRSFVQEATGINALNMTLSDFRGYSMPELEHLMEEYYSPEFSCDSVGNVVQSIAKTKKAIVEWK